MSARLAHRLGRGPLAVDAVGHDPDPFAGDRGVGGHLVGAELGHRDHEPGPLRRGRESLPVELHPRRVNASGITSGAASCTVTTSGRPPVGGTAGDGACSRSTGATRRAGAGDTEHVPRVVEHRRREREDHRIEAVEAVRAQRARHVVTGVPGGERGHVDALGRE